MCAKWSTAIKIISVKWVVHHSVKIVILLEFPDDKKKVFTDTDCRLSTNTLLTVWLNEGTRTRKQGYCTSRTLCKAKWTTIIVLQ